MSSSFSRFRHSPFPRGTTVTLIALAWSSLLFGGEIHDAAKSGDLEKVKTLLQDNPDLAFSKDTKGWTPLHEAAFWDRKDVAESLLANKAKVNAKDNYGQTPLHLAAGMGHKDVADLLLVSSADVNVASDIGRTPLHLAAIFDHKDMVELLRQHGGHE